MRDIFLVACTRRKLNEKAAARDLYISLRFIDSRKIAEKYGDGWFILSAKHRLLSPNRIIKPYDLSLASFSRSEREAWARAVLDGLLPKLRASDRITILGDETYSEALAPIIRRLGFQVRQPLLGRSSEAQLDWLNTIANNSPRLQHLNQFYELLDRLQAGVGGMRTFRECGGKTGWPNRGVYFFFEDTETRFLPPFALRVVRVGTHGVSAGSRSTLWMRLRTHRGTSAGGGGHRSSILRLHIGAALLAKSRGRLKVPTWGVGQYAKPDITAKEARLEHAVSMYISRMKLLWLAINDSPSPLSDRAYIERNAISLLAGPSGPLDPTSTRWLGNSSPHPAIRRSALWNVDYVSNSYDERFLDVLAQYVSVTLGEIPEPPSSLAPPDWHKSKRHLGLPKQAQLFQMEA